MNLKTYKIYTLGCKVNQYDSLQLKRKLDSAGLQAVESNADIAIVNTCAVTATAITKSNRAVNLAKKENPEASIALIGCWPALAKKGNHDFPPEADPSSRAGRQPWADNIDYIFGVNEIDKLLSAACVNNNPKKKEKIIFNKHRARYTIKVQDGCEQYCSYCIIPFTRGKLKSRQIKEIINEITSSVKAGYREIVLSGIHLGMYGQENRKQKTEDRRQLFGLMKEIIKIKNIGRIRLSSIEVNEVSDEIIELIKTSGKVCKHLHIPLQAGGNKILKSMNRPYTKEQFRNKIKCIKASVPDVAISTDVIVGFPGESENDFEETLGFVKEISFSRLHIFPFSAHEEVPASKLPHQLSEKIKTRRANKLRVLGEQLKDKYQEQFKGKDLDFVIEQEKDNYYIGKSEYYFDYKILKSTIKPDKFKIGVIYSFKYE